MAKWAKIELPPTVASSELRGVVSLEVLDPKRERRAKPRRRPVETDAPRVESDWTRIGLDSRVSAVMLDLGYSKPLPVQEACFFPAVVKRKDIAVCSETGSGKTFAFGIPIIQLLLENPSSSDTLSCVVL